MTSFTEEPGPGISITPGPGGGKPPIPDYLFSLSIDAAHVYIGQPIPVTWSIKALHPNLPGPNAHVQAQIFGTTATPLYTTPAPGPILLPGGSQSQTVIVPPPSDPAEVAALYQSASPSLILRVLLASGLIPQQLTTSFTVIPLYVPKPANTVPRSLFPSAVTSLELTDPSGGQWKNPMSVADFLSTVFNAEVGPYGLESPGNPYMFPDGAFEWYPLVTPAMAIHTGSDRDLAPGSMPSDYAHIDEMMDATGVSGYAVSYGGGTPHDSGFEDIILHPFHGGHDFDFTLQVDPQYAPHDPTAPNQSIISLANREQYGIDNALGVEIDNDLLQKGYEPRGGDRVAVYGRWIVDAGHFHTRKNADGTETLLGFHTEIHPYLLLGVASAQQALGTPGPYGSAWTRFTLTSRPYMTSQLYPHEGDPTRGQGLKAYAKQVTTTSGEGATLGGTIGEWLGGPYGGEIGSAVGSALGALATDIVDDLGVGPFVWGDPGNSSGARILDAASNPIPLPSVVGEHHVGFLISPPSNPSPAPGQVLHITGQFHCRLGSQIEWHPVVVNPSDPSSTAIAVWLIVHLWGDQLQPIKPSRRRVIVRSADELNSLKNFEGGLPGWQQWILNNVVQFVDFYEYDPLTFANQENNTSSASYFDINSTWGMNDMFVDQLPYNPGAGVLSDPSMPYPVYGWFNLYWGPPPPISTH